MNELPGFSFERKLGGGKEEWLTPPEIIEALGPFDLDPCSPINRPWNTAKKHYTILDNGLSQPWEGRVWCNPPYGRETNKWLAKCNEYKNVTALIFARTETNQFFDYIWNSAYAICFLKGRIAFYNVDGKKGNTCAGSPSVLVTWDVLNTSSILTALHNKSIQGKLIILAY